MMMTNRFDLEQQIMDCWHIVDDLKILTEYVLDSDDAGVDKKDKVANVLIGLEQLYAIKFDKMFRTFEQMIKDKNIT
jgi:hypothetical protein